MDNFQANLHHLLIGSMPLTDHGAAMELVDRYTPKIPLWVQLPTQSNDEQMVPQFMHGMPGYVHEGDQRFINTAERGALEEELLYFYEDYLVCLEHGDTPERFRFASAAAGGFNALKAYLGRSAKKPLAVKGQVTGPITFGMGVKDAAGRSIFYDDQLRDAAVKLLAANARWQVREFGAGGSPVILFIDEPALAGVGSAEMISISSDEIHAALTEVVEAVHAEKGLAGIHVCANTDWSVVLGSGVDIVNFDAFTYFDRFILYADAIKGFLQKGGILAWGVVPTTDPEVINTITVDQLAQMWNDQVDQIIALGFEKEVVASQSLITPSCGLGALSPPVAQRVLELTRDLSERLRGER
jgi:methionine synthase II (cobalamin-independent)